MVRAQKRATANVPAKEPSRAFRERSFVRRDEHAECSRILQNVNANARHYNTKKYSIGELIWDCEIKIQIPNVSKCVTYRIV